MENMRCIEVESKQLNSQKWYENLKIELHLIHTFN